jgi:hypothetical protein
MWDTLTLGIPVGGAAMAEESEMQVHGHGDLRASHADRERSIEVLRAALADGRLDQDEFADRVSKATVARSAGQLSALIADLPDTRREIAPSGSKAPPATTVGRVVGVLAVASLVLGIATVVFPSAILTALPSLILGVIALVEAGRRRPIVRWTAVAGMILAVAGMAGFGAALPF